MPDRYEVEQRDGCQAIYENLPGGGTRIAAIVKDTSGLMVARLVATANVALSQHHRSSQRAQGCGSGDVHGRYYCAGLCHVSIDQTTVWEEWPCFPYLAIEAALTGSSIVAITAGELALHRSTCETCQFERTHSDGPSCLRRQQLAARWRRALREAGQQT